MTTLLLTCFFHCLIFELFGFIEFCRCCVNVFLFSVYLLNVCLLDTFSMYMYVIAMYIISYFFFVILRTIVVASVSSFRYISAWQEIFTFGSITANLANFNLALARLYIGLRQLFNVRMRARYLSIYFFFLTGVTQTNILLTYHLFTPFTSICMYLYTMYLKHNLV